MSRGARRALRLSVPCAERPIDANLYLLRWHLRTPATVLLAIIRWSLWPPPPGAAARLSDRAQVLSGGGRPCDLADGVRGEGFRGRDGEPDTGRFGNYFTHIVLGGPDASDPFDGLLPIELWNAPHWCTSESAVRELPELSALAPGGCGLDWALATLSSRRKWLAPVLDAALLALHDGPRVVLVESDTECAAAWVAWVSYALPPDLAPRLSFSTFDGQPRHARELHMCVTTPGSDIGFAEYELGRDVTMLQPLAGYAPPVSTLYARAAETLLTEGSESVLRAARAVGFGSLARRGAELAVVTERVELAQNADEVVAVLELLADATARREWPTAHAIAAALPAEAFDDGVIRAWWRVHATARDGTNEAAREVVDAALARLLPGSR